jgi:hypothetical protein
MLAPAFTQAATGTIDEIREIATHLNFESEIYLRTPRDPDSMYMIRVTDSATGVCLFGPGLYATWGDVAEAFRDFVRDQDL